MISMRKTLFVAFVSVLVAVAVACGSKGNGSGFDNGDGTDGGSSQFGDGSCGLNCSSSGDGGSGGCVGLQCKEVTCSGGGDTTITGQVFDPIGLNPLYDVAVYVPSELPLAAITSGVTCDRCGSTVLNPASTTLTDEDGKFTLTHVPVDKNVPVVIQIGKWRKTYNIDVTACQENPMPTPLTLPKNGSEGDMPQMAVAVNGYDALECLLYGMGVDESEFTNGASTTGHVHMYSSGQNKTLWASKDSLMPYDITLLDCEGGETPSNKSDAILQGMHDYAGLGGKIFATHYHYLWFKGTSTGISPTVHAPADFVGTASWNSSQSTGAGGSGSFDVNTSFPKGASFAQWLVNVGASTTSGKITLKDYSNTVKAVQGDTTKWISNGSNTEYMSFNTPVGVDEDQQCGKVVFTDLHVTSEAVSDLSECEFKSGNDRTQGLTPQQKALEFLFFDLSSCVTNDSNPPQPPR
ncbi:MAG TPA: hypothetical protein VF407_21330 [Polyangiaceae bacterium]